MVANHTYLEADYLLSTYTFTLPEKLIAQSPPEKRGESRLMVMNRHTGHCTTTTFSKLIEHLPENCLLVANNSQVVPARMYGKRTTGGRVECLLLTPLPLITPTASSFLPPHFLFQATAGAGNTPHSAIAEGAINNNAPISNNNAPISNKSIAAHNKDTPANNISAPTSHNFTGAPWLQAEVTGLFRSSKKIPVGEVVRFSDQFFMQVQEHKEYGNVNLIAFWQGDLHQLITQLGVLPLPPYIHRNHGENNAPTTSSTTSPTTSSATSSAILEQDKTRYQTIYANHEKAGSVAAPTAGLHFTKELQETIIASGREWVEATLYVGYGTFSPVRTSDIRDHTMHAEYVELSQKTADAINTAKKENRAIIAIGTTATRILEGVFRTQHNLTNIPVTQGTHSNFSPRIAHNEPLVKNTHNKSAKNTSSLPLNNPLVQDAETKDVQPKTIQMSVSSPLLKAYQGWINIFLYPGAPFYILDGLITNFHLPQSSLLMLASAFAGREHVLQAYQRAITEEFRFFSYGDAMFFTP